jgi:hypothetical protein
MRELFDLLRDLGVSDALLTAVVPVVVGLVAAARYYRRTGNLPLARLPLRAIRRVVYAARVEFYTRGRPPTVVNVGDNADTVRFALGAASYELEWPLSYHYHGEDINARRYVYDPSHEYPHRQVHIRGFVEDDGTVSLYAHEEPSGVQHPRAHLSSNDMNAASEWAADAYRAFREGDDDALDPRNYTRP